MSLCVSKNQTATINFFIYMQTYPFIPYAQPHFSAEEMKEKSRLFYEKTRTRRSVREFSDRAVDKAVIENILLAAGSAPSGANKQPWTFCAISSPALKRKIREAAEKEEFESYNGRMTEEWLTDLAPLGTNWEKPFLETAPWLIVVFKQSYGVGEAGEKQSHYYVSESVGIACGFLIQAIHAAGLVTLTHTPSPMDFLTKILQRPHNERPFLLLPVGFPANDATVPDIQKKPLSVTTLWFEGE